MTSTEVGEKKCAQVVMAGSADKLDLQPYMRSKAGREIHGRNDSKILTIR
jgi:hypothetical protein